MINLSKPIRTVKDHHPVVILKRNLKSPYCKDDTVVTITDESGTANIFWLSSIADEWIENVPGDDRVFVPQAYVPYSVKISMADVEAEMRRAQVDRNEATRRLHTRHQLIPQLETAQTVEELKPILRALLVRNH
jgi:hypothetical protein